MPKHKFEETTSVGSKTFFRGEAEVSEADLQAIKAQANRDAETEEVKEETEAKPSGGRRRARE